MPSTSQFRAADESTPGWATPAQNDTASASQMAAIRTQRVRKSIRRAAFGGWVQQGRFMLDAGVQQVARTCFDDQPQTQPAQPPAQAFGAALQIGFEGVEMMMVERQGHAVIAAVRNQRERIVETVVGRAIGIVSEAKGHFAGLLWCFLIVQEPRAKRTAWLSGSR
jgi:hypothetical protein